MKKRFAMIICLALMLSLFAGCGAAASSDEHLETSVTELPPESIAEEPQGKRVIQYAGTYYDSTFALLYSDGTVAVAYDYLSNQILTVLEWQNVQKIWINCNNVIGLHEDGTVSCVDVCFFEDEVIITTLPDFDHLENVVDVCFMEPNTAHLCLLEDGSVVYVGSELYSQSDFATWTNVKKLVYWDYDTIFAINQDGTVQDIFDTIPQEELPFWTEIVDLYFNNYKIYGIKEDGSVVIYNTDPDYDFRPLIPYEEFSLSGAKTIAFFDDISCGLTENGAVLFGGGKIWFQKHFEDDKYITLADLSEFTNIKEIPDSLINDFYGVALRNDGTVVSLNQNIHQYVSQWSGIEKIAVSDDVLGSISVICGLHSDGTVSALEIYDFGEELIHYPENYMGWDLVDIYPHMYGGIVGICADGSVVMPGYWDYERD